MRILISAAAAVVALGLTAGLATDADAAKKRPGRCSMMAGQGTGLGQDLAKQNASMAVGEAISKAGAKASGKVAYSCKGEMLVLATCTAKQRACK